MKSLCDGLQLGLRHQYSCSVCSSITSIYARSSGLQCSPEPQVAPAISAEEEKSEPEHKVSLLHSEPPPSVRQYVCVLEVMKH